MQNDGAQFAVRAMLALLILSNGDQRLLGAMAQRCINDEGSAKTCDWSARRIARADAGGAGKGARRLRRA
ncbi:MAG: hypothetical protein HPM95_16140 [Alphaproteobacteria bacterium]|nr:hypothetical protein [Alphaproteobacteria bacterium]